MTVAATSAEPQPAVAFRPGMNRVTFTSEGDALVGNLFLPASYTERTKLPLILVGGAWLTGRSRCQPLRPSPRGPRPRGVDLRLPRFWGVGREAHVITSHLPERARTSPMLRRSPVSCR